MSTKNQEIQYEEGDSPELAAIDRELVRRGGMKAYAKLVWSRIEPQDLVWGKHLDLIVAHCEALIRCEIRDLVANVPPGSSKSTFMSIIFPCYAWTVDPRLKFICTSYSESLVVGDQGRRALELVTSDWHRARWPELEIKGGIRANQGFYETTVGGRRIAAAMGGQITGKHADILIVDDPLKPADVEKLNAEQAKAAVDGCWEVFTGTLSTRRANPATFRRVVVMQRLHEEDLAGRLLKYPSTVHLCLPMLYDPSRHCKTKWGEDWRTEKDELLIPERFPREVVDFDKSFMPPRKFASQMQQRPAPEEGNLLRREYFQNRWPSVPPFASVTLSVDANLKDKKDADLAVIQAWTQVKGQYWLLDQVSGRWAIGDLVEQIQKMRSKWPGVRNILIEDKANGPAAAQSLKAAGVSGVLTLSPEGGKQARVEAVEWLFRSLDVVLPAHAAPWVQELIEEAVTFPSAPHDDMVDAMTQYLVWAMSKGKGLAKWRKAMANARKGLGFL